MKFKERSFEFARKVARVVEDDGTIVKKVTEEQAFENAKLPEYATANSAGADFFCAEEVVIPSLWKLALTALGTKTEGAISSTIDAIMNRFGYYSKEKEEAKTITIEPTLVHTGIKANMYPDEVLEIYNRSSNPKKLGLILANSVGVVDADYFECDDNDGEIMFAYYNVKPWDVTLKVGDKVGQGLFKKVLRPERGLVIDGKTREGGFGSTDETKTEE